MGLLVAHGRYRCGVREVAWLSWVTPLIGVFVLAAFVALIVFPKRKTKKGAQDSAPLADGSFGPSRHDSDSDSSGDGDSGGDSGGGGD
jgi:uncharacterized membrane protein